jgi:hypothetical protein
VEPRRLLQEVREVSRLADPINPSTITQRAFDAARKESDTYAHLPLARDIARQLRWSWAKVLEVAHLSSTTQAKRLSARDKENQDWLTPEYIAYVLKLVAHRLDAKTVTETQYAAERKRILAENHKRYLHGRQLRLPTAAQIKTLVQVELYGTSSAGTPGIGAWGRALELAKLELKGRRNRPKLRLPLTALIENYFEKHGKQPTPRELWKFARENKLPHRISKSPNVWDEAIRRWQKKREAQGLPPVAALPPEPQKTEALSFLRVRDTRRYRRNEWRSQEKILNILIRYIEQIPANEHATSTSYDSWAESQADLTPTVRAFNQHGGWATTLELAYKQMLANSKPPKRTEQPAPGPRAKPAEQRPDPHTRPKRAKQPTQAPNERPSAKPPASRAPKAEPNA